MSLAARRLPIVQRCPDRNAVRRTGEARLWCEGCATAVHDLSAMRESEARRLLAQNVGRSICVAYRVRPDGTIDVRPDPPRRRLVAAAAAVLTACAGHLEEDELSSPEDCADAIGCPNPDMAPAIPDGVRTQAESTVHDGPARDEPPTSDVADESPSELEHHAAEGTRSEQPDDDAPASATAKDDHVRVHFKIDPENRPFMGALVVRDEWRASSGRLRFIPTRQIIADLRERWRERVASRQRSRR
jgi:hypothetical protein